MRQAIRIVEERKDYYKKTGQKYFRPWVVCITDGFPDDNQDVEGLKNEIYAGVENKKFVFIALGTATANFEILKKISHPSFPPMELYGLKFSDFFQWLSESLSAVTHSKTGDTIDLAMPGTSYAQVKI